MSNSLTPEERTPPIGLFNYARSYWRSAEQLRASKPDVTHPDAPISFLFYHAIELYLKAFLRSAGYDLDATERHFAQDHESSARRHWGGAAAADASPISNCLS